MTDTPAAASEARREGSLDAPFRHPIAWRDPDFYDMAKVEAEMERVFDICHGCRRCFNLCDSFPRLFDLIDEGPTGELDGVAKADYGKVVEACTLCDMCFMTKCPYVPPHEFDVDFPAPDAAPPRGRAEGRGRRFRARAAGRDRPQRQAGQAGRRPRQLGDRPGQQAGARGHGGGGRHRPDAVLPHYHSQDAPPTGWPRRSPPDPAGPAFGQRKAALYATCFVDYNAPADRRSPPWRCWPGRASRPSWPIPNAAACRSWKPANIADVAGRAERVAAELAAADRRTATTSSP